MPTAQGPAGPRRRLGSQLRSLRRQSGLRLVEVAREMDCSTSKISRLENGKGIPRMPDVNALLSIYGVTEAALRDRLARLVHESREQGWWERYTDGVQADRFASNAPRYTALETEAMRVRSFEVAWVHGLLQVPDYTRAVLETLLSPDLPLADELDRLMQLRQLRQKLLTERDPPLRLEVVLDESVLRRVVGSAAVMADQMAFLAERSKLPNVVVRVLPFTAGLQRAHAGPFQILEFPGQTGADVVFIEGPSGDTYESQSDVDLYQEVLVEVADQALNPAGSRDVIRRYEVRYRSPERGIR